MQQENIQEVTGNVSGQSDECRQWLKQFFFSITSSKQVSYTISRIKFITKNFKNATFVYYNTTTNSPCNRLISLLISSHSWMSFFQFVVFLLSPKSDFIFYQKQSRNNRKIPKSTPCEQFDSLSWKFIIGTYLNIYLSIQISCCKAARSFTKRSNQKSKWNLNPRRLVRWKYQISTWQTTAKLGRLLLQISSQSR